MQALTNMKKIIIPSVFVLFSLLVSGAGASGYTPADSNMYSVAIGATVGTTSTVRLGGWLNALDSLGGPDITTLKYRHIYDTAWTSLASGTLRTPGLFSTSVSLPCQESYVFTDDATNVAYPTVHSTKSHMTSSLADEFMNETAACPDGNPTVTTDSATLDTGGTATFTGTVTNVGHSSPDTVFFRYGTAATRPFTWRTATASRIVTGTGAFTITVTGLACDGTEYGVMAQAEDSVSGAYGNTKTFTCHPSVSTVTVPAVKTVVTRSITTTSAVLVGSLTNTGDTTGHTPVSNAVSFDWGTSGTYGSNVVSGTQSSIGDFTKTLTGLTCNTKYYYRAVATNSAGTTDALTGLSFTTAPCVVVVGSGNGAVSTSISYSTSGCVITNGTTSVGGIPAPSVKNSCTIRATNSFAQNLGAYFQSVFGSSGGTSGLAQ